MGIILFILSVILLYALSIPMIVYSIIMLTPANAAIDATATSWTVSAGAGSATITFDAAPTSDFDMNFIVTN